jgi:hypothetical protein
MELTANEGGGLKRMDLKEVNPYLRSLARFPLQAAFRFHRQPSETPSLALGWVRFPDSTVLAAVAERAVVTTMVTSEGRSLTEVKLTVKNQAQPFLKVDLPAGASILSADVAGQKVKPVQGPDGARVPLLRSGFRPTDAYEVSFVFLHSGAPFAKKGGSELALPSMDVPISVLQWEVYLPEQYKVKDFGGDAIAEHLLGVDIAQGGSLDFNNLESINGPYYTKSGTNVNGAMGGPVHSNPRPMLPGQAGGVVVDPQGAVIYGATVKVTSTNTGATRTVTTDTNGRWLVSGMPPGEIKIDVSSNGFKSTQMRGLLNGDRQGADFGGLRLSVGEATETVEVRSEVSALDVQTIKQKKEKKDRDDQPQQQASVNVFNLQKKMAGVLPVRVDVPRAGSSYRFARALVLDEETKLTFTYRTK